MMLRTLLFVFLIHCLTVDADVCPNGWVRYGASCYSFLKAHETWPDASITCKTLGGKLATIESAHENVFLKGYLKDVTSFEKAWLGGTDIVIEGVWNWVTGDTFDFTDWSPSEPDSLYGHNEDCVFLDGGAGWRDDSCSDSLSFICEKESPRASSSLVG